MNAWMLAATGGYGLLLTLVVVAFVRRPQRPAKPLPTRDPGTALAEAQALDQFAQTLDDLDECEAIWTASTRKEDAS